MATKWSQNGHKMTTKSLGSRRGALPIGRRLTKLVTTASQGQCPLRRDRLSLSRLEISPCGDPVVRRPFRVATPAQRGANWRHSAALSEYEIDGRKRSLQRRLGPDPLLREVAPPEVEGLLEVALGRIVVVDGEVGHRETMRNPGQSLNNSSYSLPMELLAELVDQLRCSGSFDL